MVHDDVNNKRKKKKSKPLERVARDLAKKYKLVIFDELEILDIADAMIVSNLFNLLIDKGVSFIITSNYKPNDLYKNGLQRSQFEPFIELINNRMNVIEIKNDIDLRFIEKIKNANNFLYPLNSLTQKKINNLFLRLCKKEKPKEQRIFSMGRELIFKKTIKFIVFLDFSFICSYKFSANDYIKISNTYNTFFIDKIPLLGRNKMNEIRRFIILIDVLYEKKKYIIIRSEKKLSDMVAIKNSLVPFKRTMSRISEMTSSGWNQN